MAEKPKRDEVLRRLLKTPPKPHDPSVKIAKWARDVGKELGQFEPNEDPGSEAGQKRHHGDE